MQWHAHHQKSRRVVGLSSKSALLVSIPSRHSFKCAYSEPVSAADAYALGLLLHTVFNPTQPPPPTAQPPHPPPQPSSRGAIPSSIFPSFKKLLNPNPKSRMSPKSLLDIGMAESGGEGCGFFVHNRLVKVCAGLDGFNLSSESDKASFLRYVMPSECSC